MKKIVALLICVLLIAALAIPAFAAEDETVVTVTVDKATAKVGDEIVLTFSMTGSNKFKAGSIDLVIDRKVFEVVTDADGLPAFVGAQAFPWMIMPNDSVTKLVIAKMSGPAASINGVLGTLTLRVISECPSTEILSGANAYATPTNSEGNFPITVNGTSITITGEHTYDAWAPYTPYEHIHTCTKCNAQETAEHSMVKGEVTLQPNCAVEGKQDATCSVCGLNQPITLPTNDDHSWNAGEITTQPGCETAGVKTYTCLNDENHTYTEPVEATGHDYTAAVTKPTCTEDGYTTYTCACGDSYKADTVPATGHGWLAWEYFNENVHQHYCPKCYTTETADHEWGEPTVINKSTCTVQGMAEKSCKICGAKTSYHLELDPTNHNGYTTVVTKPTCTVQGYTTYTCACGDSYKADYVTANGHTMGGWEVVTPATCETDGQKRKDCENCDYSEPGTIAKLGHDYKSEVTTPATCKDEGVLTYTCQNDASHTYTKPIPKTTTHTAKEGVSHVIKPATCTETGISSGECAVCGVYMDEFPTDPLGHDMGDWIIDADSTCAVEGKKHKECSRCDHTESGTIEKKDHNYKAVVTDPTCIEKGYTTHTCSACGNSYETPGAAALGHEFLEANYVQTKDPTCTEKGEKVAKCTRCDETDTKEIPANGHDYKGTRVEPTCTEPGKESGKCSVCGDEVNEKEIPALKHEFVEYTQTKAPTCTEKGEETAKCTRCDATDVKDIAALGHTYGDWISVDEKNHKHSCTNSNCDHEETVKHDWNTGNVTVKPTHTEFGVKTFECEDCHATREEEVAKLKDHTYSADAEIIENADGTVNERHHMGVCACGDKDEVNHSFDIELKIIEEATEEKKGKKLMACACGHTKEIGYSVDGTLDKEPGMGDITGQIVMTGVASFSMIAAAAYVCIRKRFA